MTKPGTAYGMAVRDQLIVLTSCDVVQCITTAARGQHHGCDGRVAAGVEGGLGVAVLIRIASVCLYEIVMRLYMVTKRALLRAFAGYEVL